jgi:hypothetical protein
MSNCVCIKCGAGASSKCPYCRNVFDDNQLEAAISHVLKFEVYTNKTLPTPRDWLSLRFAMNDDESMEAAAARLLNVLLLMKKEAKEDEHCQWPSLKQYFCVHVWQFREGCESTIGCGHKNP